MKKILIIVLTGLFIGGCGNHTEALKQTEIQTRIDRDIFNLFKNQLPVRKPLTLWDVVVRALKYNLEHRVKLMEIALAKHLLEITNYKMLPELVFAAGYNMRDRDQGGFHQSLLIGQQTLEPSTGIERRSTQISLNIVLNILDMGISHAIAKQKGNQVMIARERRRKVIQNIVKEVQEFYWYSIAAERLLVDLKMILKEIRSALKYSETLEQEILEDVKIILHYQKRLLETYQELFKLYNELTTAKMQLAQLINLPPGASYELVLPTNYELPQFQVSLKELEFQALFNQPLLREEDYFKRIGQQEIKKTILRMFPGLEISWGQHYSSNRFLYNQNWKHAGLQVSWNLLNLFTGGFSVKKLAETELALADHRRMGLSMAILTQVWISYQYYQIALKDFKFAQNLFEVNEKLTEIIVNKTIATTGLYHEFDKLLVRADAIKSSINRDLAYAQLHTALAQIRYVIGVDPSPGMLVPDGLINQMINSY